MPRGGKRPGAGRPAKDAPVVRTAYAQLDDADAAMLTALELRWRVSGSEAVRRAIREAAGAVNV